MKKLPLLLSILLISLSSNAQTISGKITDNETGEILPNCNISILGTSNGTISNEDGFYFINLAPGEYNLLFQYIGYHSDTVRIILQKKSIISKNVSLKQALLSTENIYVYAGTYSKAEQLILRASKEKQKILKLLQNYSCKSYTKTTIRTDKDSLKNKYGLLLEFYSQLYWNKPGDFYEIVQSQRISANLPEATNIFTGNSFLDINSDRINLGQIEIIGPTAPDAIHYYRYDIVDTVYQDNKRLFRIKIQPKNNNRPLMSGELYLADKIFIVQHVNVLLNEHCDYDFYKDIHIIQSYRPFKDSLYLPYYSLRESIFQMNFPGYPKLVLKKENYREEYSINNQANTKYAGETRIVFENSLPFDQIPMNPPPLTEAEVKGYAFIDSIVTHRPVINLMTKAIKLLDVYSDIHKLPIGNFSDFYRFNKVEGHFLGAAFNTKETITPFKLYAGYGYGFEDKKYKYIFKPEFHFNFNKSNLALGIKIEDNIATRENNSELPVWYNTFNSIFSSLDYFDYFYSKGSAAYMEFSGAPFTISAALFYQNHSQAIQNISTGIFNSKKFLPVVKIDPGRLIGSRIETKYSSAGYRNTAFSEELIQNQNYSEFKLIYEKGIKNWGSNFDYQKLELLFFMQQNTYYKGILDLTVTIGSGNKTIPAQKLFELESGFSGFERFKTFQTLRLNSFVGRQKLAFFIEHNFQNSLFQLSKIPLIEDLPIDFSLIYNYGWAGNKPFAKLKSADFYSEWGIGIGRILTVFKIELLWRTKKIQYSKNFAFSIKLVDIEL